MKTTKTESMTAAQFQDYLAKEKRARNSKFGAVPCKNADGDKFRSQHERRYMTKLQLLAQTGEVAKIERELPYNLTVNDVFLCTYVLDFRVTYTDGRVEHVDTKSKPTLTALFKLKQKLMLAVYDIEVIPIFEGE